MVVLLGEDGRRLMSLELNRPEAEQSISDGQKCLRTMAEGLHFIKILSGLGDCKSLFISGAFLFILVLVHV